MDTILEIFKIMSNSQTNPFFSSPNEFMAQIIRLTHEHSPYRCTCPMHAIILV